MSSESLIGLPMSRVSSRASSSACCLSRPAKRIMVDLRLVGARRDHTPALKVLRAFSTARSASAASQLAICAKRRPSTGLMHSNVAFDTAAVYSPLMKARPSIFRSWARCSQSARVRVVIRILLLWFTRPRERLAGIVENSAGHAGAAAFTTLNHRHWYFQYI
ncbi:hypothetical protein D9M71_493850 [compost metagenome]